MSLPSLGIKRPVTILMLVLMVLLLSTISLTLIPIDLYPDMELPVIVVQTDYEGAGPREVENMVTRPLEEVLSTVDNLSQVSSVSRAGESEIRLMFEWGTDMDFAALDTRELVDMIREELPDEVGDPVVMQIDPDMLPVIQAGISADMSHQEITELADGIIKSQLERQAGVASIDVMGGLEREIEILVDPYKLSGYGLDYESIEKTVQATNLDMTGGDVPDGEREYLVRIEGEIDGPEELKNLVIGESGGTPVELGEVARIEDGLEEMEPVTRLNQQSTVAIGARAQSDANTVEVAQNVKDEMERLEQTLPGNIEFEIAMDQSTFIQDSIDSIVNMGLMGALLAMLILWLFLGNVRSTLVIAVAIPISIISTFNLLYFMDYTINIITMAGLMLGIGMVVDNAIILLENIYRKREEGFTAVNGAVEGSHEISGAIIAATLTSIAAFLPTIFTEGIAGIIFRPLAWTVIFSLSASLVVALTVVPLLSVKLISEGTDIREKSIIPRAIDSVLKVITEKYSTVVKSALHFRKSVVLLFALLLVSSLLLLPLLGFDFLPDMDTGEINIDIDYPLGTPLEATSSSLAEIEEDLTQIEEIDVMFARAGGGTDLEEETDSRSATIDIRLLPAAERKRDAFDVAEEIRRLIPERPGTDVSVSVIDLAGGMGAAEDVAVNVQGDDLNQLETTTDEILERILYVEGVENISSSFEDVSPDILVELDTQKAFSYGLTTFDVGNFVTRVLDGEVISFFREEGEEYDIRMQAEHPQGMDVSLLETMLINSPQGEKVPIEDIARLHMEEAPQSIDRQDRVRQGTISVEIGDRDLGSTVEDIQEEIDQHIELPSGYTINYGGEYEDMTEAFEELGLALALAVILVYMVMASQFESLLYPFIIMFTMPQTIIGVIIALLITGRSFSIVAFVGLIMLAGIVVNNGIVMVDYINLLYHNKGHDRFNAVVTAGRTRLRPILMTTLTTVLGMFPLAFETGEGAETRAPMAVVVIGGLLASTLVTLILIPVVYTILDDVRLFISRKFNKVKVKRKENVEIN